MNTIISKILWYRPDQNEHNYLKDIFKTSERQLTFTGSKINFISFSLCIHWHSLCT